MSMPAAWSSSNRSRRTKSWSTARRNASVSRAVSWAGQVTKVPSGRKPLSVTRRWRCGCQLAREPCVCRHATIVFFGEQHDDPATHAAELAVLAALGERRERVVLSVEMFERDVPLLLNQYLDGSVSEKDLMAGSRPWDRYNTDYRPLVELSRIRGWPEIAANVPRGI